MRRAVSALVVMLLAGGCAVDGAGETTLTTAARSTTTAPVTTLPGATTSSEAASTTSSTLPPTTTTTTIPQFDWSAETLDAATRAGMEGVSWHAGCPVSLDELRLVRLRYWGFDGQPHWGELVVNSDSVTAIVDAFGSLYDSRFPIRQMRLVDEFAGDDEQLAGEVPVDDLLHLESVGLVVVLSDGDAIEPLGFGRGHNLLDDVHGGGVDACGLAAVSVEVQFQFGRPAFIRL